LCAKENLVAPENKQLCHKRLLSFVKKLKIISDEIE